jgi:hypothetical protein
MTSSSNAPTTATFFFIGRDFSGVLHFTIAISVKNKTVSYLTASFKFFQASPDSILANFQASTNTLHYRCV